MKAECSYRNFQNNNNEKTQTKPKKQTQGGCNGRQLNLQGNIATLRERFRLQVQQQFVSSVQGHNQAWQNSGVLTQHWGSFPKSGMIQAGMGSLPGALSAIPTGHCPISPQQLLEACSDKATAEFSCGRAEMLLRR